MVFMYVVLGIDGFVWQFGWVSGGDDQVMGIGFGFDLFNYVVDLVYNLVVWVLLVVLLFVVNWVQVVIFQCLFVLD